jgi:hypothetical protein
VRRIRAAVGGEEIENENEDEDEDEDEKDWGTRNAERRTWNAERSQCGSID